MGISMLTVPPLLELARSSPTNAAKTWEALYHLGKNSSPKFAVATLLSYGYAAYTNYQAGKPWASYTGAGALTIALVPWTLILMMGTNNQLLACASGLDKAVTADKATGLITTWGKLNMARGFWPLAGAMLGMWTLLRN
jgi:hypothetical protein